MIRQLLAEAGHAPKDMALAEARASGAEVAASGQVESPETYVGYARADRFASPGGLQHDVAKAYASAPLKLNDWTLEGEWLDSPAKCAVAQPRRQHLVSVPRP